MVISYGKYNLIGGKKKYWVIFNLLVDIFIYFVSCMLLIIKIKMWILYLWKIYRIIYWINCVCLFFFLFIKIMFYIIDYMVLLLEVGDIIEKY